MDFPVLTRHAQVDLDSAAVKVSFGFARKARIVAIGLIYRNASTATSTVEVNKRILSGSATGEAVVDTIVKPASDQQGKYIKVELDEQNVEVDCGDELTFETIVDPAEAQLAECVVEYIDLPENRANLADAVESA